MAVVMPWGEVIRVGMSIGILVNQFTLNDPVLGLLDGVGVLDGNFEAEDITTYAQSVAVNRGRNPNQNSIQAGSATVVLNNNDRRFDPINEDSPYWDITTAASGVQPRRFVEILCEGERIFVGAISAITISYVGDYSTCTIEAADDFTRLANMTIEDALTPIVQVSGNRVTTILDLPEVDYPADQRNIALGGNNLQALLVDASTNILTYLQSCALSDQALLFMSRDGVITYTDPLGTVFNSDVAAIFTDTITGLDQILYTGISTITDSSFLYNKIIANKQGGADVVADDATSQATYGISTLALTNLLLNDDADVTALSTTLLGRYKDPVYRFDDLQFTSNGIDADQRTLLNTLEIGDNIQIIRTFATGSPLTVELYYQVDRLNHSITTGQHTVTIGLGDLKTVVYPFVLDDVFFGILDASNALA